MMKYRVVAVEPDYAGIPNIRIASLEADSDTEAKVKAYEKFYEDELEEGDDIDEVLEEQDCSDNRIEIITNMSTGKEIFNLSDTLISYEEW